MTWAVVDVLGRGFPVGPAIVTRARYGEDRVATSVEHGVDQYVIVGAGYETFAMRHSDLMARLTVYEIDQPRTGVALVGTFRLCRGGVRNGKDSSTVRAGVPAPDGRAGPLGPFGGGAGTRVRVLCADDS